MHQYATLEDTIYFGFAANLTTGAAGDGATPLYDVRLGGAAAGAAPVLSGTPTLLTHANYSDGCYEVAVVATTGNGFAAGNTYLVFVTLTIDSVTPAACIGTFKLAAIPANIIQIGGDAQSMTDLKDFADAGYDPGTNKVQGVVLVDTLTTYTGNTPQTGDSYALANGATGFVAIAGYIDTEVALIKAKTDLIPASPASTGDAMTLTGGERTTLAGVINTTQITESYRADGAAPTPAQALCELLAHAGEASISGTTKTLKKFDGTTSAETFTLDSATAPTSITRAT